METKSNGFTLAENKAAYEVVCQEILDLNTLLNKHRSTRDNTRVWGKSLINQSDNQIVGMYLHAKLYAEAIRKGELDRVKKALPDAKPTYATDVIDIEAYCDARNAVKELSDDVQKLLDAQHMLYVIISKQLAEENETACLALIAARIKK